MAHPPGKILFVGDSITTDNYCVNGGYPVYVINYLNARDGGGWSETRNRAAHPGFNTWDGANVVEIDIERADTNVPPDYIFLYYGANDQYPNDNVHDYTPIAESDEESWKAAYTYTIERLHTEYPNALMWIGKSYRCNSLGDVEPWMPNLIFPWTDDLVAAIPYLYAGIRGYEILQAGYPESMGGHSVHPACYGNELLAAAIRDEMFPLGSTSPHRPQRMNGGMQALSGGFNG